MGKKNNTKEVIKEFIFNSSTAVSHLDIQEELDGSRNRVTIYRVLDKLVADGVIHKIIDVDGVSKYAACKSCTEHHQHDHIHFSCQKCKSLTCLEETNLSYNLPGGYNVSEANFTLSGLCPACSS